MGFGGSNPGVYATSADRAPSSKARQSSLEPSPIEKPLQVLNLATAFMGTAKRIC